MKQSNKIVTLLIFALLFVGCKKALINSTQNDSPKAIFEQTWKAIDEKYSFLNYKQINWDSIGNVYRTKVTDNINDDSLFNLLDKMLYHLKDGHVNLKSPFNRSRNWEWFLNYPQNYDEGLLLRNYIPNFKSTGPFRHQLVKEIGYIHYSSFSNPVSNYDMDYIINEYKSAKGLIIDVRDNGGGNPDNIFTILNRFTNNNTLVGKTFEKKGVAHDAFGHPVEIRLKPNSSSKKYLDKKIVILTNRMCYSATSHFIAWASALPNVTVIGDVTGGGGGLPTSIQLSNGWVLRYSSTISVDANDFNFENGTAPDIKVDMNATDMSNGIDSLLETAINQF